MPYARQPIHEHKDKFIQVAFRDDCRPRCRFFHCDLLRSNSAPGVVVVKEVNEVLCTNNSIQGVDERYSDSKIQDKINRLECLKSSFLIWEPNISKGMAAGNTIDQCVKIFKINLSKKADKR